MAGLVDIEATDERVLRIAKRIAFGVYGGYPVDAAERKRWPTWSLCVRSAEAAVKEMDNPPA